jgi:hypothetical protein
MPLYDYYCETNGRTVEVLHGINDELHSWGEICYAAQIPLGDTDVLAPVRKVISAPAVHCTTGNSELKSLGFAKLVRRDDGVYENVTAMDSESRYMRRGDPNTLPDLHSRISS